MLRALLFPACLAASIHGAPGVCAKDFPQVPDDTLTPGVVNPDVPLTTLCRAGYSETIRHVTTATKRRVYEEYGIGDPGGEDGRFEVDHRVPLEVNGSNDIRNLWPQSYETTPFNAHDKDKAENKARVLVCTGRMTLKDAQAVFLGDWRVFHRQYYGAVGK